MFKKLMSFLMVITLVIPMFMGAGEVYASEIRNVSMPDSVKNVQPYVEVNNGVIGFKHLPKGFYEKYNLEELQKHFDNLNDLSQAGTITINKDLSIQDNSITPMTTYGEWTCYWWGYDRNFTDSQAQDYEDELLTAAGGAAIVSGVTTYFPPISGIAAVQAGYWALLAARVSANNEGNGVYVAVTWALVFDVEPL